MLSIVMPVYNEEECIERVVRSWLAVAAMHGGTLIAVDDGSKDHTGETLDRLAAENPRLRVVHQKNAGHGAAVLRGYHAALQTKSEFVFQVDSDDEFSPADFELIWKRRHESPFILGWRKHRQAPKHRRIISKGAADLAIAMFGKVPRDPNIPFRLMRADLLATLLPVLPRNIFAPNLFLSVLARWAGIDTLDIPIQHRNRATGTVSILGWKLVKVCLRSARELIAFRIKIGFGKTQLNAIRATATSVPADDSTADSARRVAR